MHHSRTVQIEPARERQVRAIGFDPSQLTPAEQVELIDLYHLLNLDSRTPRPADRLGFALL